MSFSLRFSLPLCFLSFSLAASTQPVVQLDRVDVISEKEKTFSLPIDAPVGTGSRLGLTLREMPASVSVITQEVMQARGLRTAVEAVEAAVGMTGGTQFGSIPTYSTRGFGGNNVTILRDGIRQNTASQSSRTIDAFLLDRIEVLKGPASLMFGEGAVGGAVNYVSKVPDGRPRREVAASASPWGSYRLGFGIGGPLASPALAYRIDVSNSTTDGYQDRNHQDYFGASAALRWTASEPLTLTWFTTWLSDSVASYYGTPVIYDSVINTTVLNGQPEVRTFNAVTDRMVNARIDPAARRTNYNILDNYAETENSFQRLRADLRLSASLDLRSETYIATQLLKWRNLETHTWNPLTRLVARSSFVHIYRDDVLAGNRTDLAWRGTIAGRPTRWIAGFSIERNDQIRGGTPGGVPTTLSSVSLLNPDVGVGPTARFQKTARIRVETGAAFVENTLDLATKLRLVTGLRMDAIHVQRDTLANPTVTPATGFSTFHKRYRPWTGRAGLVYEVSPALNAYAAYSTAAEPVTQLVSFGAAQANFSLQQGRQWEAGIKGSLLRGRADFTLALFDIEKTDLLSSTLDSVTGQRISQQIGAQTSRGIEVAVALTPSDGWRIEANAAYTDAAFADFNEALGSGVISRSGKRPPNVPEWVANVFVSRRFPGGLVIGGGPRYVGDRFANNLNSVVANHYTTVDLSVGQTWGHWHVTLRGRNLLDEEYEPVAGTTMRRLADPRSVEVSTRVEF